MTGDLDAILASDAYRRGAAAAGEKTALLGPTPDLAAVGACPRCKRKVRRLPNVPITGTGLDQRPADRAHCAACLQEGVVAALVAAGVR